MIRKTIFKNRIPHLRLESDADFKNYYSLSFVIGIGILVSITMFVIATSYHHSFRKYQFSELVNSSHSFVESQFQNQKLHFKIFKDLILNSNFPINDISLDWIGKRMGETEFSCLYFVVWNGHQHKVEKVNRGIEDKWCKSNLFLKAFGAVKSGDTVEVVSLDKSKIVRKYLVFTGYLSRISKNKKSYLVGYLPIDRISITAHSDIPLSMEFLDYKSISENAKPEPIVGETKVVKALFLDGNKFEVVYFSAQRQESMIWPWMTLLLGFIITGLTSYFYLKLLIYSTQTARKVNEKTFELKLATENAIRSNETKSKFLANVSHDVRTPLNLMLGMSELLVETELDAQQLEYVTSFSRAGYHLLELINGVLDIARIESGELVARFESVALPDFIANIAQIVSGECRRKKLNFSYNIETSVPRHILTDSTLLRQVLLNLLFNSMKFTPRGDIQLNVECTEFGDNQSNFIFTVNDTGEGIPKADLEKIFEAFHQNSPCGSDLGVGLGLSIVKSIVNHLGGEVKVDSQVGYGSTFRVELKLRHDSHDSWLDRHLDKKPQLQDKRVFLYCHTELKQHFLKNSLEHLGCSVTIYLTGEDALRTLENKTSQFDYFIIDLVSDTIGGLELLKLAKLKKSILPKVFVMCPLVHRENDLVDLEKIGVENIVFKPVNMDVLIKNLASGTGNEKTQMLSLIKSHKIALDKPLNIIVAEDDLDNRILISHYLQGDDVNIYFAEDGSVALDKYTLSHQDFDLIVTDIQMPRMDGFQLIKNVRKFEDENGLNEIPIIVLTADAQRDQINKLEIMGASEYLTKPITKSKLKQTIVNWS